MAHRQLLSALALVAGLALTGSALAGCGVVAPPMPENVLPGDGSVPAGPGAELQRSTRGHATVTVGERVYRFETEDPARCTETLYVLDMNLPLVSAGGEPVADGTGSLTISLPAPLGTRSDLDSLVRMEVPDADGQTRTYIAGDDSYSDPEEVTVPWISMTATGTQMLKHVGDAVPPIEAQIAAYCTTT